MYAIIIKKGEIYMTDISKERELIETNIENDKSYYQENNCIFCKNEVSNMEYIGIKKCVF